MLVLTLSLLLFMVHMIASLPVQYSNFNTIPGGSNYNPNLLYTQYAANGRPIYDVDGKWPAYGWDAPANYQNFGKINNDAWIQPPNVPRWYYQQEGGRGLQGTAGYLFPMFYGKR